jgi:hypothetical protein
MLYLKPLILTTICSIFLWGLSQIAVADTIHPSPPPPPTTMVEPSSLEDGFTNFPCGLNLGNRQLLPSMMVRGKEDGTQAINFPNWAIPFNVLTQTLKIKTTSLPDGFLELRSSVAVTRIDPKQLVTYPEIGLAIKVRDLEKYLGIKAEFDLIEYAVKLTIPSAVGSGSTAQVAETPIEFDGLTVKTPAAFSWGAWEQRFNFDGTDRIDRSQGLFTAAGTLLGASWYTQFGQSNWHDALNLTLSDAQIIKYTDYSDYLLGGQSAFWNRQESGNYWGMTGVWRQGFTPTIPNSSTINPSARTQASRLQRTIVGTAAPGTLVRLLPSHSLQILGEVLVDGTGVYRFENIPVSGDASNYRLWLFSNGQLSAAPAVREVNFVTVPGQLPTGATATIASVGLRREAGGSWGSLGDLRGAVVTNWGVTEWLTVGSGIAFDRGVQALGELYFQPNNFPLEAAISIKSGTQFDLLSNVTWQPDQNLRWQWNIDRLSHRVVADWRLSPQLTLNSTYDSRDALGMGFNYSDHYTSLRASFDTNARLRWGLIQRLGNFQLHQQGNEVGTISQLLYSLHPQRDRGSAIQLSYQTDRVNLANEYGLLAWKYRPSIDSIFEAELGYGLGRVGGGWIASGTVEIFPGINLRGRYQTGINSVRPSFSLELVSNWETQAGWRGSQERVEQLRTHGGIAIVPFFDRNANGRQDPDEQSYLDPELLSLNHRPMKPYRPKIQDGQIRLRLAAGKYRLDFDPAGFPIDWRTQDSGYAVEVAAGSYTTVFVPLVMSYTIQGVVRDREGKPLGGAKVEAIPHDRIPRESSIFSITNGNGEYYLEALAQGSYQIQVNGRSPDRSQINLDRSSEPTQTLDLQLNY